MPSQTLKVTLTIAQAGPGLSITADRTIECHADGDVLGKLGTIAFIELGNALRDAILSAKGNYITTADDGEATYQ